MPNIFEYDLAARGAAAGAYGSPVHHVQALSPRDFRTSITPTPTQRTTLIVAGCYIVAIAILWCVPSDPRSQTWAMKLMQCRIPAVLQACTDFKLDQ